jgi:hypothetical protein
MPAICIYISINSSESNIPMIFRSDSKIYEVI